MLHEKGMSIDMEIKRDEEHIEILRRQGYLPRQIVRVFWPDGFSDDKIPQGSYGYIAGWVSVDDIELGIYLFQMQEVRGIPKVFMEATKFQYDEETAWEELREWELKNNQVGKDENDEQYGWVKYAKRIE